MASQAAAVEELNERASAKKGWPLAGWSRPEPCPDLSDKELLEEPKAPPAEGDREETAEEADYREAEAWHNQRLAKLKEKMAWAASSAEYKEYRGYYQEAWR